MIMEKIKNFFFEKKVNKKTTKLSDGVKSDVKVPMQKESQLRCLFKDFVGLPEVIKFRCSVKERSLIEDEKFPYSYR